MRSVMSMGSLAVEENELQQFKPLFSRTVMVDARKLDDGGIGTYARNLIEGLLAYSACTLKLLVFPHQQLPAHWLESVHSKRIERVEVDIPLYSLSELFLFARRVDWGDVDIFHVPHFTLPFGIPVPTVVTVHDLIQITHPEKWFYPFIASCYLKHALRSASQIIAISKSTGSELMARFSVKPNMVEVVGNCINLSDAEPLREHESRSSQPFLLSVLSNSKPHKGLKRLLEAYSMLRNMGLSVIPELKVVGKGSEAIIDDMQGVTAAGVVTQESLHELYKNAIGVVIASDTEGFCLPVLEARSFGTAAITTPIPAVQELLEPFDMVSEGFSSEQLALAMYRFCLGAPEMKVRQWDMTPYHTETVTAKIVEVYKGVLK